MINKKSSLKVFIVPLITILIFTFTTSFALCNTNNAKIITYDVIEEKDKEVKLRVKLEKDDIFGVNLDIEDEKIDFYSGEKIIGSSKTDDDGFAELKYTTKEFGLHKITVKLSEDSEYKANDAYLLILVPEENKKAIVCDIDNTIAKTNPLALITTPLSEISMVADSNTVLEKLSKKYYIIYLSHRHKKFLSATRKWLTKNKFPDGILIHSDWDDFYSSKKYKSRVLKELSEKKCNLFVGIGNTESDAKAYTKNKMSAIIIDDDDDELPKNSYRVKNWQEVSEKIETFEKSAQEKKRQ